MKIVKAYKCEFCLRSRPYASRNTCEAHEERCFDNPASRSCATCKYLNREMVPIKDRPGYVTLEYECKAKKPGDVLTTDCMSWKAAI